MRSLSPTRAPISRPDGVSDDGKSRHGTPGDMIPVGEDRVRGGHKASYTFERDYPVTQSTW